jgi:hypothetical protein
MGPLSLWERDRVRELATIYQGPDSSFQVLTQGNEVAADGIALTPTLSQRERGDKASPWVPPPGGRGESASHRSYYFLQASMTKRSKRASDLPPDLKARSSSSIRSNTCLNSLTL